jgi:hypothetical protein
MFQRSSLPVPSSEDQFLSFAELGVRWRCHPKVAAKRANELRIPITRFNKRSLYVRFGDVLQAESKLVVSREEIDALAAAKAKPKEMVA